MAWYWFSFVDPDSPKEDKFLGALLIEGEDHIEAWEKSHEMELNPGGEVMIHPVPPEYEYRIDKNMTYRLLSREECDEYERRWYSN